jgi:glycosyltransferase involved in cell wall biosynthesis
VTAVGRTNRFVLYTAALPRYRRESMDILSNRLGRDWTVFAGDSLLDPTVRTDEAATGWVRVTNRGCLGRRVLFQWGHWSEAVRAEVAIFDLNPRSITAWLLLSARRLLRRRTLLWGHLYPRQGSSSRTTPLRAFMRRRADGCIVYSFAEAADLAANNPDERVWVAPNAIYRQAEIFADHIAPGRTESAPGELILYVGRLEPEKKPGLLLEAFALLAATDHDIVLCFVGSGSLAPMLEKRAAGLGLTDRVRFEGSVHDAAALRAFYANARCAVSPGYCGLSLTQSMCFGVPMVIGDPEPHAPEIELRALGLVSFFAADSVAELAAELRADSFSHTAHERDAVVQFMRTNYSAEAMAAGLFDALHDVDAGALNAAAVGRAQLDLGRAT